MVRTYGACAAPDDPLETPPMSVTPVAPARNRYAALGFDLRQSWAEAVGIPPSGALDEFDRKQVRNDYPLLALWEMGVRHLRIPLQDLRNAEARRRIRGLLPMGQTFTLYSYGLPTPRDAKLILDNAALLSGWEISFREQELARLAAGLRELRLELKLPILLSRMWEHEDNRAPDGRYFHVMNHGFTAGDAGRIARLAALRGLESIGLVFRAMSHDDLPTLTAFAHKTCAARGLPSSLHLRLTGFNPAGAMRDDTWAAQRTAEALFCAAGTGVTVLPTPLRISTGAISCATACWTRPAIPGGPPGSSAICTPRSTKAGETSALWRKWKPRAAGSGPAKTARASPCTWPVPTPWARPVHPAGTLHLHGGGDGGGSGQRLQIPGRRTPPRGRGPVFLRGH